MSKRALIIVATLLLWLGAMGWLVFAAVPSATTLAGGVVIAASTVWIARREARARKAG